MADILAIFAHPDDESFVGGGTFAYAHARGKSTTLLCMTDGQAGRLGLEGRNPVTTREQLGALRRNELQNAARLLKIQQLITPGWPDGELATMGDEAGISLAVETIRTQRPIVMISFGPEGAANQHRDHMTTHRWATRAFILAADPEFPSNLPPHAVLKHYWVTWPPEADHLRRVGGTVVTTVVEIGPQLQELKHRAFECHASQHDHMDFYNRMMKIMGPREYFHLAQSRIPAPTKLPEACIFEGITATTPR